MRGPAIVLAEHAENEIRKDFTRSERVAIGKAVEAELGKRQGQRTDLASESQGELVQNFAQVESGQKTIEIAAQKAGFGNKETYRQAKTVVDHAEPDQASYLRGKRYNGEKKAVGEHTGNQHMERDQNDPIPTADRLATEFKVSPATVKRDGQYAAAVDTLADAGIEPVSPATIKTTYESRKTGEDRGSNYPRRFASFQGPLALSLR
ncbi:MAG: hypothetical protein H6975_05180 [Gammaproteobacteria bacterium]|nr:hypothetical protein [Gammaproteobacteria bacterium]